MIFHFQIHLSLIPAFPIPLPPIILLQHPSTSVTDWDACKFNSILFSLLGNLPARSSGVWVPLCWGHCLSCLLHSCEPTEIVSESLCSAWKMELFSFSFLAWGVVKARHGLQNLKTLKQLVHPILGLPFSSRKFPRAISHKILLWITYLDTLMKILL